MRFPREVGLKRSKCESKDDFNRIINTLRDKSACYTSLYSFNDMKWNGYKMTYDHNSAVIDRAWWDFDGDDDPQVKRDDAELIKRLDGTVLAVATGRGFHVHQILREPVIGDRWPSELTRYEREMAQDLSTLDCIGTVDRLCRVPNTLNPKRGRWAVVIDPERFAADPLGYEIPKTPDRTLSHLNPFKKQTSSFSLVRWVADNPPETNNTEIGETMLGDVVSADQIPMMPCLDAIHTENPQHFVRVAFGQHLVENLRNFSDPAQMSGDEKEAVIDAAVGYIKELNWRDFREQTTRTHLASIIEMKTTPSCRWFAGKGMCKGKCWRYDGTVQL